MLREQVAEVAELRERVARLERALFRNSGQTGQISITFAGELDTASVDRPTSTCATLSTPAADRSCWTWTA